MNFIFFLSGLQSVPKSVQEAAAVDCRSPSRRFWTVTFPLLAPTSFFLLIINITYALFDTFGIIDLVLKGEPGNNPVTLVYKVFLDGFRGNDLGGSSAQSVILLVVVGLLVTAALAPAPAVAIDVRHDEETFVVEAGEVLDEVVSSDEDSKQVWDSYTSFRKKVSSWGDVTERAYAKTFDL